ncbi:hypothetical protein TNCV_2037331 [Trichonephila clavipes]|nr:hypothetical protein TNCV_2037331 [Trichonephila clavipes]
MGLQNYSIENFPPKKKARRKERLSYFRRVVGSNPDASRSGVEECRHSLHMSRLKVLELAWWENLDHGRLFPEGWEKKINHDGKFEQIKKLPQKTEREDVPQSAKRSNEAECRRGEGKNAGRKTGRPKAVNQDGERSPQNPE